MFNKPKRALILSGGGARGAYQAGVLKFLKEMNWEPDLICGTSVGAVNAVALGCGLNIEEIILLWKAIEKKKVYRVSYWKQIQYYLLEDSFVPIMDTTPLRNLLEEYFDIRKLRSSKKEIIITAVSILNSQLKFFNNHEIDIEHIMASSAIPIFFPWQYINGEPYWDGGVMANTPILPALEKGAKEIIVVLLSPVGGQRLPLPKNRKQVLERVFEQSLIGSYQAFLAQLAWQKKIRWQKGILGFIAKKLFKAEEIKIATVAPVRMLGFGSLLRFTQQQTEILLQAGYNDARYQLAEFFELTKKA
ncbi:MAG: patatin-like phospholipase family protein [Leptospiraceae bacterium]|nr:patatin-like phospholipase family protein [Leptospiraceae bacterium]MDW7975755.1 patatin-like phospholipase family protein [Leptospiraceae bacterium]